MSEPELGIVYVLTNPAMPGLVKIGKTSRNDVETRLGELYSTGVPVPFDCAFAGRVKDETTVERAFHQAFGPYRINAKREFFKIEPDQAIALLKLMTVEDVTPDIQQEADKIDDGLDTGKKKLRRPNINFTEMNIPIGAILEFTQSDATVEVMSDRKVRLNDDETSLSNATRQELGIGYDIAPCPYWTFKGKNLRDIYNETYDQ